MSITGKFRLTVTDVKDFALDLDDEIVFTVTGETIEGVNEMADEVVRSFIASKNIDAEDRVTVEKFIE